tara:strand:+ start:1695 stop:2594 length:900 start_codon:yes stop_codon:yes gene_type:complete
LRGAPQLGLLERSVLGVRLEGMLVRSKLPAGEPRDHLLAHARAERVDHRARPFERLDVGRLDALGALGAQLVEVVEDLLAQVHLHLVDLLAQLGDLLDVTVVLEVHEQRVDRLQQVGRLRVHALLRHHDELLDRRHEHLQPLERADRERQVALGVVEALDVTADLVHHRLARLRLRLDVAHLDEELCDRLPPVLEVPARRATSARLLAYREQNLLFEPAHPLVQAADVRVDLQEAVLVGEEPVDVSDRVKVGRIDRVGRGRHLGDGRLQLRREGHRRDELVKRQVGHAARRDRLFHHTR